MRLDGKNTQELLALINGPLFAVDVVNVRLMVYSLPLDQKYWEYISSYRLGEMHFRDLREITVEDPVKSVYRPGVVEIARAYQAVLEGKMNGSGMRFIVSQLNSMISNLPQKHKKRKLDN